jgi:hypothetical protein
MVREHAAEQGYSFVGPVTIVLELVPDVAAGQFRIRSGVTAGAVVEGGRMVTGAAGASDVAGAGVPAGALPGRPRLVLSAGGRAKTGSPESRGEEQVLYLTHSVTVMGRAADADLRLNDPGISRRHAEVRQEAGSYFLIDLGSTNGSRVDGSPVVRHELRDGDRIEVGSTTLVFHIDQD